MRDVLYNAGWLAYAWVMKTITILKDGLSYTFTSERLVFQRYKPGDVVMLQRELLKRLEGPDTYDFGDSDLHHRICRADDMVSNLRRRFVRGWDASALVIAVR